MDFSHLQIEKKCIPQTGDTAPAVFININPDKLIYKRAIQIFRQSSEEFIAQKNHLQCAVLRRLTDNPYKIAKESEVAYTV